MEIKYRKRVVTSWKCSILDKINKTSDEGIYHYKEGWICDCGVWTTGSDRHHKPITYGLRKIYIE